MNASMTGQTNDLEIRVLGMSRSGNHVVIQWLLGMLGRPAAFLNCAEGKTNPFESARPMLESIPDGPYASAWLADTGTSPPSERAALIHSYEDCFLRHAFSSEFEANHDTWVGPSNARRDVIILRDPFNLFASRYRAFGEDWIDHTARRIWKQHARPFLGKSHAGPKDAVLINFNRWAASEQERRRIAEELGLEFNDEGRWLVPPVAGGSSFDGQRHHDHPERMKIDERWRSYRDDAAFAELFDDTMVEFAREIFELSPALERWLEGDGRTPFAKAG